MKIIFLSAIFIVLGGLISATFNNSINFWFDTLNKPFLNPPNLIFTFVWPILYISLAIFIYMIDKQPFSPLIIKAKRLFVWQLIINFLWTPVFFGTKSILGGLIVVIILDYLVLRLIMISLKINKTCAFIILPYFCWILFATYLNTNLFFLN